MLKDKFKKIGLITENTDNKKKIENLIIFLIIIIVTLIAINFIIGDKKEKEDISDNNKKLAIEDEESIITSNFNVQDDLSKQLEDILQKINGVGKVKVLIAYSQTSQSIPLYNEDTSQKDTEEKDTSGGTRKVVETDVKKDVIYQESNGQKVPITQSILSPKIEGAIITAQGASNPNIKADIIQAVEAVTGLSSYKIQVFTMSQN